MANANQPGFVQCSAFIFSKPSLFEFTARLQRSPRGEYELTDAVNGLLSAGHKLAGFEIEGQWVDVPYPATLAKLEKPEKLTKLNGERTGEPLLRSLI